MTSFAINIRRHRNSSRKHAASWLAVLLLACLTYFAGPALGQTGAAAATPFVMGFDEDPKIYGTIWGLLIYQEAFKRMGIPLVPGFYHLARRAALADEGVIDGEGGRVHGYGAAHPNLVRVEESIINVSFALYTANPELRLKRIEDLSASSVRVEYRRGLQLCENMLKPLLPPERLSNVTSELQGLQKLLAGRTDVYCDIESIVKQGLTAVELKGATSIRKIFTIGNLETYPYLHKKRADLAPRLAATLKQMKAEGLVEKYRLQAEREMGWTQ